jgi:hypothetical protein
MHISRRSVLTSAFLASLVALIPQYFRKAFTPKHPEITLASLDRESDFGPDDILQSIVVSKHDSDEMVEIATGRRGGHASRRIVDPATNNSIPPTVTGFMSWRHGTLAKVIASDGIQKGHVLFVVKGKDIYTVEKEITV